MVILQRHTLPPSACTLVVLLLSCWILSRRPVRNPTLKPFAGQRCSSNGKRLLDSSSPVNLVAAILGDHMRAPPVLTHSPRTRPRHPTPPDAWRGWPTIPALVRIGATKVRRGRQPTFNSRRHMPTQARFSDRAEEAVEVGPIERVTDSGKSPYPTAVVSKANGTISGLGSGVIKGIGLRELREADWRRSSVSRETRPTSSISPRPEPGYVDH